MYCGAKSANTLCLLCAEVLSVGTARRELGGAFPSGPYRACSNTPDPGVEYWKMGQYLGRPIFIWS